MKKRIALCAACGLVMVMSGCVPLIVGGAVGAVGGYAASQDTVRGETDIPYVQLWDAAEQISRTQGVVKQKDGQRGYIFMIAQKSKVWIQLVRITQATTSVRVSARRFHMPNSTVAQDIFVKIMDAAK